VKAVVLVGGEGTRLRPLTYSTVKAMVPVLNKPFLEYVIRYLKGHNIDEIVLALGYKPDAIMRYFGDAGHLGVRLIYSVESHPLGTAGAIKYAEQYLGDTFLVFNGDVFTDVDLTDMLAFHRSKGAKVTIALTPVDDPTHFGVAETDEQQHIVRFVEKPPRDQVTSNMINAGIYIIDREILKRVPPEKHFMFERDVFPQLIAEREPVFAYTSCSYWIDTGTPEKYLQLHRDLLCGRSVKVAFHTKETMVDKSCTVPASARLTAPVLIDRDCSIGSGARLEGPIVIGAGCTISAGASLENSILWQNVTVGENAVLKNCIVASDNQIEKNANLKDVAVNNVLAAERG